MIDVVRYSAGWFHIATFRLGPTINSGYRDAKMFRAPSKNADGFIEWNEDTVRQADCHCQR
ncbi:hypothetical protein, partial [Bradyrhizobium japonicum]|uniref:hypothetical protein n=1 Tax=Bradyrhizobium japonicum TaxID=375 RepID=UPI001AEE51D7